MKVSDIILFDGQYRNVSVVNADGTFRLFKNDMSGEDEGCFSQNDIRIGSNQKRIAIDYAISSIIEISNIEGKIEKTSVYGGQMTITFENGNRYSLSLKKLTDSKVTLDELP